MSAVEAFCKQRAKGHKRLTGTSPSQSSFLLFLCFSLFTHRHRHTPTASTTTTLSPNCQHPSLRPRRRNPAASYAAAQTAVQGMTEEKAMEMFPLVPNGQNAFPESIEGKAPTALVRGVEPHRAQRANGGDGLVGAPLEARFQTRDAVEQMCLARDRWRSCRLNLKLRCSLRWVKETTSWTHAPQSYNFVLRAEICAPTMCGKTLRPGGAGAGAGGLAAAGGAGEIAAAGAAFLPYP